MKRSTGWVLLATLALLIVLAGCAEERTLISKKNVVPGIEEPDDAGRSTAARREPPQARKYREHWWQFWRPKMPENVRVHREERVRTETRRRYGD
jgi:hypothetical protein